jgi:hypothetical protein
LSLLGCDVQWQIVQRAKLRTAERNVKFATRANRCIGVHVCLSIDIEFIVQMRLNETLAVSHGTCVSTGCSIRSCSAACCKLHKESTGCSGKRHREAFIEVGDYNESDMMSDYRMLEDMHATHQNAEWGRAAEIWNASRSGKVSRQLRDLVSAARKSGVRLELMSLGAHNRCDKNDSRGRPSLPIVGLARLAMC